MTLQKGPLGYITICQERFTNARKILFDSKKVPLYPFTKSMRNPKVSRGTHPQQRNKKNRAALSVFPPAFLLVIHLYSPLLHLIKSKLHLNNCKTVRKVENNTHWWSWQPSPSPNRSQQRNHPGEWRDYTMFQPFPSNENDAELTPQSPLHPTLLSRCQCIQYHTTKTNLSIQIKKPKRKHQLNYHPGWCRDWQW